MCIDPPMKEESILRISLAWFQLQHAVLFLCSLSDSLHTHTPPLKIFPLCTQTPGKTSEFMWPGALGICTQVRDRLPK